MFLFASSQLQYDRHNSSEQKQILARVYADAGWEIPHLLKAMESAPDFYFDSISLIRLERWSRGRIVLLGDAGYCPSPLSGQGTNLALVGAYTPAGQPSAASGRTGPGKASSRKPSSSRPPSRSRSIKTPEAERCSLPQKLLVESSYGQHSRKSFPEQGNLISHDWDWREQRKQQSRPAVA